MLTIIFYFRHRIDRGNSIMIGADRVFSLTGCLPAAIATAISGIKYLWDNRSFINTAKIFKKIAILCSISEPLHRAVEPVAIRMTWEAVGSQTFTFYTENSNVFAFFVCLLVAVCPSDLPVHGRQLPLGQDAQVRYCHPSPLTMTFPDRGVRAGAPTCADQGGVVFHCGPRAPALPPTRSTPLCAFVSLSCWNGSQGCLRGAFRWRWIPTMLYGSVALWANYQQLITGLTRSGSSADHPAVLWCGHPGYEPALRLACLAAGRESPQKEKMRACFSEAEMQKGSLPVLAESLFHVAYSRGIPPAQVACWVVASGTLHLYSSPMWALPSSSSDTQTALADAAAIGVGLAVQHVDGGRAGWRSSQPRHGRRVHALGVDADARLAQLVAGPAGLVGTAGRRSGPGRRSRGATIVGLSALQGSTDLHWEGGAVLLYKGVLALLRGQVRVVLQLLGGDKGHVGV